MKPFLRIVIIPQQACSINFQQNNYWDERDIKEYIDVPFSKLKAQGTNESFLNNSHTFYNEPAALISILHTYVPFMSLFQGESPGHK